MLELFSWLQNLREFLGWNICIGGLGLDGIARWICMAIGFGGKFVLRIRGRQMLSTGSERISACSKPGLMIEHLPGYLSW